LPVIDGNDIRFSRLSTAQGLSQTRVLQIVQDDQGFMWFGTQYGLDRYDGYEYKVFAHDPAREDSLSCVFIHSLFKDRSGALWVGCDHSLDRFDSVTETFTHYQIEAAAPGELANAVDQISQDRAGLLWLATGKGLFSLNPDTGQVIHYVHDPSNPFSLVDNKVQCTLEDRSGRFWVVDNDDLEEFDRESGRVRLRIRLDKGVHDASLYEDHLGTLWITYETPGNGSGLAAFDRPSNRLTAWIFPVQPGWDVKFDCTPEPLEADQEIFRTPARSYHPEAHKHIKLGLDITFGKSEVVAGKPVLETLNHMMDFASTVIPQFEPFLT
jgi:ligand-binding sensor domain-containing protein